MANVSIYRNTQKKLKNGNNPIQIRITNAGVRRYITLGMNGSSFNGNVDTFDDTYGRFKIIESKYKLKNEVIQNKLKEAESVLDDFSKNDIPFSFELFERKFSKKNKRNSIINFFDEEITRLKTAKRFGYAIPYKTTRDHLVNYHGSTSLRFDQVNYSFLTGFESFLMARGVLKSTIHNYIRTLRTVYNTAIKSGLCFEKDYPFSTSRSEKSGYSLKHLKHESTKRALTIEQVRLIKNYSVSDKTSLFHYRNYWMFMYYCRGMNFADIADLKWTDIIEGKMTYHRNKNNRKYSIDLIPQAAEILELYKGAGVADYVFPIHATDEDTEARYYQTKDKLKLMNKSMNRLTKKLEIDANLTSYVARHSWANVLKNKGHSSAIISEGLGHNSEKTTMVYLKQFDDSIVDEAGKDVV